MTTFEYTGDPAYTLSFPNSWKEMTSISDFGGYVGESGSPDFDVPGKIRTFGFGDGDNFVPLFAVIEIDLKYKGHKSIPAEDKFLGQNGASAFYGGLVSRDSQEWSYLYDGRQDQYIEQIKDIDRVFASFKIQ